jgi:hypothetical protein
MALEAGLTPQRFTMGASGLGLTLKGGSHAATVVESHDRDRRLSERVTFVNAGSARPT